MTSANSNDQMVAMLRDTMVALVRKGDYDLSARQLGVFLTCYLDAGEHTVRGGSVANGRVAGLGRVCWRGSGGRAMADAVFKGRHSRPS